MDAEKSLILDDESIRSKIHRIAYEIYERNYGQKEVVLIGIDFRGGFVAEELAGHLRGISDLEVHLVYADRDMDSNEVSLPEDAQKLLKGKHVVLVDDVLYSGSTMFNAIAAVMDYGPARIQNAVLIDRGHRNIPVRPDFVGLVLATTLKQYVFVEVSKKKDKVQAFLE